MQPEHGNYRLLVEGAMIHNYPSGGFNAEGIKALADEILAAAPKGQAWVLFEHPKLDAGLTPDGIEAIKMMYDILIDHGCMAIALEIGQTFGNVLERDVLSDLKVPSMTGSDEAKLESFLLDQLNGTAG